MSSWLEFGPFLRRMRLRRGISQARLAELLGCDRTYIWRLEHHDRHPSKFFLQSLTTVLNFSVDEEEIIGEFIRLTLTHRDSVPLAAANNNPAI